MAVDIAMEECPGTLPQTYLSLLAILPIDEYPRLSISEVHTIQGECTEFIRTDACVDEECQDCFLTCGRLTLFTSQEQKINLLGCKDGDNLLIALGKVNVPDYLFIKQIFSDRPIQPI